MSFLPITRIYLQELSSLINRKDKRSIRKWCVKNSLNIYKDASGEYVVKPEFELAYNTPVILELMKKHGVNWKEYYDEYSKGELINIINLNTKTKRESYIPKGKLTLRIFSNNK